MSIGIQPKNDYSFLFSGLGGNSGSSLSSFLADYASIKNGTYGKLMKAYYKQMDEGAKTEKTSAVNSITADRRRRSAVSTDELKAYKEVQSSTDDLKTSADKLLKTGVRSLFNKKDITTKDENGVESTVRDYDKDAIYSAVNDFVKDYNAVVKAAGSDYVNNSSLINRANNMQNATQLNSKSLAEVGITINKDNTLTLDKDTFKNSDMGKVQNLFNGTGSYGYSVSSSASMINFTADNVVSKADTYTGTGAYNSINNVGNFFSSYL
ncbi:MAG: hypothetical protein NC417_09140 [Candidatus Gastranaerophilales bacterium]|nr:hypothetical protein [Candidatus Gastranaerophilales bacterium]